MTSFLALMTRDLRLAFRQGSAIGTALGFYLVAVSIVPLGLGPDLKLLSRIAPGIVWVSFLLSAILSVEALFQEDRDDGSLEALAIGPLPAELIAASKSLVHWLMTCVPLIVVTPLAGLFLNLEIDAVPKLMAALTIGTIGVSFVAAAGAALTLGLRRGALLLPLLILPLFVPFLIFGVGAMADTPGAFAQSILLLAALSLFCVAAMPFAAALALRLSLE
jgi:heme exporter protein B